MKAINKIKQQLKWIGLLPMLLLLLLSGTAQAQDAGENYLAEPIQERSFDKAKWEKAKKDMTFVHKQKKKQAKKEKAKKEETEPLSAGAKKTMYIIGICLLGLMLVLVVIRMVTGKFWLANPKITRGTRKEQEFTVEEVEENLHESDLEIFLRQTLANKSYKLAIRIYYLMIIKELSLANFIKWSKEKTNREYLREMRKHASHTDFKDLTRTFERAWYGDYTIDQADFATIKPRFEQYMKTLKS